MFSKDYKVVARVNTVTFQGVDVLDIDVQVQIINGLPAFQIVGLPDKAIAESRERVRAALHALGLSLPAKRLTVNLAPADVMKEGSHFDLPIALGILAAMEVIPQEELDRYTVLGELSLDGSLRAVAGILPAAMHAHAHKRGLICPETSGPEAAWADIEVIAADNLISLMNHLKGKQIIPQPEVKALEEKIFDLPDMKDVKGQETAKRALEVTAAGGHNLLMMGPPGSGKSMLAARLPSILPPLAPEEAIEVSTIHSIAGELSEGRLVRTRPFRDPHHSASLPSIVGGGQKARPGEVSLSHHGVLFLDELPEFSRQTLESLRQPLETRRTLVSRANYHVTFPANFQFVAAMNPCRCGYIGDASQACSRAPKCALDYQSKISGPLFDRIDIHIDVPAVQISDLVTEQKGEASTEIAERVVKARKIQKDRFEALGFYDLKVNAEAQGEALDKIIITDSEAQKLLTIAAEKMKLSARSYYRVLRVARTLADLHTSELILKSHIAEALVYRRLYSENNLK